MHAIERILLSIVVFSIVFCVVTSGMLVSTYTKEMNQPYIQQIFIPTGFERWDQPLVNLTASGKITRDDWYIIENMINEWNTLIEYPKLGYNSEYPDIEIVFDDFTNEQWAGCAWAVSKDKRITHAYIKVRTSWPYSRDHVLRHELGHAVGLCYHSNHPNSIMYKSAIGVTHWSQEDLQVLRELYSTPVGLYFGPQYR